jgi:hypothetical protein
MFRLLERLKHECQENGLHSLRYVLNVWYLYTHLSTLLDAWIPGSIIETGVSPKQSSPKPHVFIAILVPCSVPSKLKRYFDYGMFSVKNRRFVIRSSPVTPSVADQVVFDSHSI